MSIKVMTMVFDRYPNGGGEMLLALALADHASDDGSRVYPSIKHLAAKTRQAERSVQYQLRRMEEAMWLLLENSGNGGRNQHRMYCINPEWIKGADFASLVKGAIDDIKGAIHNIKGATDDAKGCKAIAPAYNHHESSEEPSEKKRVRATRISANWMPSDADAAYLFQKRPELNLQDTAEKFRDYWIAHPKGEKMDWPASWRTWVRNERGQPAQQRPATAYQAKHDQQQALINRIQGGSNATRTLKDIN